MKDRNKKQVYTNAGLLFITPPPLSIIKLDPQNSIITPSNTKPDPGNSTIIIPSLVPKGAIQALCQPFQTRKERSPGPASIIGV